VVEQRPDVSQVRGGGDLGEPGLAVDDGDAAAAALDQQGAIRRAGEVADRKSVV
jgi:hypothetical protein